MMVASVTIRRSEVRATAIPVSAHTNILDVRPQTLVMAWSSVPITTNT
jgi:hypothetical protein